MTPEQTGYFVGHFDSIDEASKALGAARAYVGAAL